MNTRLSNYEYNRIASLVEKGMCLNQSDFFREAVRKKLEYQEQRICNKIDNKMRNKILKNRK